MTTFFSDELISLDFVENIKQLMWRSTTLMPNVYNMCLVRNWLYLDINRCLDVFLSSSPQTSLEVGLLLEYSIGLQQPQLYDDNKHSESTG